MFIAPAATGIKTLSHGYGRYCQVILAEILKKYPQTQKFPS